MAEHNIEGSYGYFMGSDHGKSYDECLAEVRKYQAKRRTALLNSVCVPFTVINVKDDKWNIGTKLNIKERVSERGAVYEWQFTLPGATNTAISKALNKQKALYALEQMIAPLEFASKCGLPKAIKPEELTPIIKNAEAWIEDDMKWDSPHGKLLTQDIRIYMFNAGVNIGVAIDTLDGIVFNEWKKINMVDNTIIGHLSNSETMKHLEHVLEVKKVLDSLNINNHICIHNMIVKKSTDIDALAHALVATRDKYACPICS